LARASLLRQHAARFYVSAQHSNELRFAYMDDQRIEQARAELLAGLLSGPELEKVLACGERAIYAWCSQGLPFVTIRRRRYFSLPKVREFFESRTAVPRSRKPGRPRKV
jgi:hypothetical protein